MSNSTKEHNKTFSSDWYINAMKRLVEVVKNLSQAKSVEEVIEIVRITARELTNSDGATFILRDGDKCYYVEENAISPLWKGMRFPIENCVSGWAMQKAETIVIKNIYKDPRIPHDLYRETFVKSLAVVPIRRKAPIGAIGNYWAKEHIPSAEELSILEALADTTSVALENTQLYSDLKSQIAIVQEREAKIRSQKETLEMFTRALAHDLKEPVRTINSYSELINQENNLYGKTANYFSYIDRASHRMLSLVETVFNYMQLGDPSTLNKETCDMNTITKNVIKQLDILIKEKNARITYDTLPIVKGNSAQIHQIIQHLVSNALWYNDSAPEINISAKTQENSWLFKIKDNGYGIEKIDLERIFLPFKRASNKAEGIGMGLAICTKIIEAHKGKIWCESKPNEGSTFCFTIPANSDDNLEIVEKSPTGAFSIKESQSLANLLIVDDMESDLELTETIVQRSKLQFNICTARSGKKALEIMRSRLDVKNPIDLVFLDINMPQMDGFETLQMMKADITLADIPVVMCTGSSYDKDKERAKSLGAIEYLEKPVKKESLEAIIASISNLEKQHNDGFYSIKRKTC